MSRMHFVFLACLLSAAPPGIGVSRAAQPARIGRLPLLVPLRHGRFGCRSAPVTPELQKQGIVRMLIATDTSTGRVVSLGVRGGGRPRAIMVMASEQTGQRSEGETVSAMFAPDGRVASGTRMAFTGGMPAVRSEDRRAGLFPGDTAAAASLAKALLKACGG